MGEEYEPSAWDRIEPTLYGLSMLIMNVGIVVAALAAIYLLYGLFGNQLTGYPTLAHADKLRILANIALAGKVLTVGLAAAAIGGTFAFRNEESTGYILLGGAALFGFGIPYGVHTFVPAQANNNAFAAALGVFVTAAYVPAALGAVLVVKDIAQRLVSSVREKPINHEVMQYGGGATTERKPVRTSLLAKCWEGGYCRDFIRPHCPIFLSRKACWREKRGCYCEEDIVSNAAAKVQGVVLDMAPEPKYNFANPAQPGTVSGIGGAPMMGAAPVGGQSAAGTFRRVELTMAQKIERCKHCVIYNEHEREKYKLLLPITGVGGVAACLVAAPLLLKAVDVVLTTMQTVVDKASFVGGGSGAHFTHPGPTVEWIFVGAFTVMIVSKLLQLLEWACFTAKI